MTIPTPKYEIGDVVWHASTRHESKRVQCPDCLDTGTWHVSTPAGEEFEADCPRCPLFGSRRVPPPTVQTYVPDVQRLTIGSVRIDTARPAPIEYMCRETGVGSGIIYAEDRLHDSEEEARRVAEVLAADQHEKIRRADVLSKMTWTNTEIDAAEDRRRKFQFKLEDVLTTLEEPEHETADQLRDAIRRIIEE